MDPLTQMLLGAATSHAVFARSLGRRALPVGAVAGELADADVFLAGFSDPALPFELHRHFTHALAFVPVGGLLAAAPFLLFRGFREKTRLVCGAAILAYFTHGLLDNCTSYGTHLLWPFIAGRTAWDIISIIDPVFTLTLLLGVAAALVTGRGRPAGIALALALAYLGLGIVQHDRALVVQEAIATHRDHAIERGRVTPALGTLLLWRSTYVHEGRIHADGIHVPFRGAPGVRVGTSRPRFGPEDVPAGLPDPERAERVFDRFEAFADGYTAAVETHPSAVVVGDMRYSFELSGFRPIWGLSFNLHGRLDVTLVGFEEGRADAIEALWSQLRDPEAWYEPLADVVGE